MPHLDFREEIVLTNKNHPSTCSDRESLIARLFDLCLCKCLTYQYRFWCHHKFLWITYLVNEALRIYVFCSTWQNFVNISFIYVCKTCFFRIYQLRRLYFQLVLNLCHHRIQLSHEFRLFKVYAKLLFIETFILL